MSAVRVCYEKGGLWEDILNGSQLFWSIILLVLLQFEKRIKFGSD